MRVESVGRPKRRVARSPVARIAFQWFSFNLFPLPSCENVVRIFFIALPPPFFGPNQIFLSFLFIRQFLSNNGAPLPLFKKRRYLYDNLGFWNDSCPTS